VKVTVDVGDTSRHEREGAVQMRSVAVAIGSGLVVTLAGAMPALWRGGSLNSGELWTLRGLLALAIVLLVAAIGTALAATWPLARGGAPAGASRDVQVAAAERDDAELRRREGAVHAAGVLLALALAALAAQVVLFAFAG
jgi:hypothetical protein